MLSTSGLSLTWYYPGNGRERNRLGPRPLICSSFVASGAKKQSTKKSNRSYNSWDKKTLLAGNVMPTICSFIYLHLSCLSSCTSTVGRAGLGVGCTPRVDDCFQQGRVEQLRWKLQPPLEGDYVITMISHFFTFVLHSVSTSTVGGVGLTRWI